MNPTQTQLLRLARRGISWLSIITAFHLTPVAALDREELESQGYDTDFVYPDKNAKLFFLLNQ